MACSAPNARQTTGGCPGRRHPRQAPAAAGVAALAAATAARLLPLWPPGRLPVTLEPLLWLPLLPPAPRPLRQALLPLSPTSVLLQLALLRQGPPLLRHCRQWLCCWRQRRGILAGREPRHDGRAGAPTPASAAAASVHATQCSRSRPATGQCALSALPHRRRRRQQWSASCFQ